MWSKDELQQDTRVFCIESNENANIGYDMIIWRNLQAKLGYITNFKRKVLTWKEHLIVANNEY